MVTVAFKSFDSFKQTINSIKLNPNRVKPDRFFVTNANGAVKKVAQVGMSGMVVLEYNPATLTEIQPNDPWILLADPSKGIAPAIEIADIGEAIT